MTLLDQIHRITPDGTRSTVTEFAPGTAPAGLVAAPWGDLYVAAGGFEVSTGSIDPALRGVYRAGTDGSVARLPGTGAMLFPNDVTLDERGNLYATDTVDGAVWRIPRGGLLLAVPILPDGSAGEVDVASAAPELVGVDGIALDAHGDVYAASGVRNLLTRVRPGGSVETLATAEDGLNQPSTVAFGTTGGDQETLFVLNFSIYARPQTPGILAVRTGVPGAPVP